MYNGKEQRTINRTTSVQVGILYSAEQRRAVLKDVHLSFRVGSRIVQRESYKCSRAYIGHPDTHCIAVLDSVWRNLLHFQRNTRRPEGCPSLAWFRPPSGSVAASNREH